MNIADRIQHMRKTKGISQEELADKIGVSRQSVSKWESEQSMPDMDKVILMSDYFEVTTDYILKGIESKPLERGNTINAIIFVIVATVMEFIGLIVACAIWYELQTAVAVVVALAFMAIGCMIFGVGITSSTRIKNKDKAKRAFWTIDIWLLTFAPLSFVYNILFTGFNAPYPVLGDNLIAFSVFWLVYIAVCLGVVFIQVNTRRHK